MSFVMSLDIDTAIRLIHKAFHKKEEDRAFELYASIYPNFTKNNFKKFTEFYKVQTEPISTKPSEDILSKAKEILRKAGEKHGNLSTVRQNHD